VIVIAATNKIDVLDDALLRAGRFDRRIFVELPNLKEREQIIAKYLESIPNSIEPKEVAKMTVGFSGASLATLINEAALKALRDEKIMVHMSDVEAVKAKVKEGKKRLKVLQTDEKMQQSNYQAAKVVSALFYGYSFEKISIISDDIFIDRSLQASRNELMQELMFYLSGTAMMQLVFGEHFSSGEKDLSHAKKLASDMVKRFGMGSDILGQSDDEKNILEEAFTTCTQFLQTHQSRIQQLAVDLQQNEVLNFKSVKETFDDIL